MAVGGPHRGERLQLHSIHAEHSFLSTRIVTHFNYMYMISVYDHSGRGLAVMMALRIVIG
jgi:hypothetical protein